VKIFKELKIRMMSIVNTISTAVNMRLTGVKL